MMIKGRIGMEIELTSDEVVVVTAESERHYSLPAENRRGLEDIIEGEFVYVGGNTFVTADLPTRPEHLYDLVGRHAPADVALDGNVLVMSGEIINDSAVYRLIGADWKRTAGLAEAYGGEIC